jgi:hypothetical protein
MPVFWVSALLLAGLAGAAVTAIAVTATPLTLLLVATAVVAVGVAALGVALTGDILSPLPPLALVFLILDVGRPFFILGENRIGPTRAIDDESLNPELLGAMTEASALLLLGLVCLALGYASVHLGRPGPTRAAEQPEDPRRYELATVTNGVLALLAGLGILGFGILIFRAGGVTEYIANLANRTAFFLGQGFITKAFLPLKVAAFIVVALAFRRAHVPGVTRVLLGVALLLVMLGDFLTGGRATLIIGTLVPLLIISHHLRRRVSLTR